MPYRLHKLSDSDRRLLREAICARHAVEVFIGDGTIADPRDVTRLEELYRELGGTFEQQLAGVLELSRPRDKLAPAARLTG